LPQWDTGLVAMIVNAIVVVVVSLLTPARATRSNA
jgi:hypothetical protein